MQGARAGILACVKREQVPLEERTKEKTAGEHAGLRDNGKTAEHVF